MYVNPFWFGVMATVFVEVIAVIGISFYAFLKEKNRKDEEEK